MTDSAQEAVAQKATVTDIFSFFSNSGLTLGAFAARCGLPIKDLVALLVSSPAWYGLDEELRERLFRALQWGKPDAESLGDGWETVYVAMRGPRGSVRWHHWRVSDETLEELLNHSGDDRRLIEFETRDHLNVVLNTRHLVTFMYGDEDTDCLMESVQVVSTQTVNGDEVEFRTGNERLQQQFDEFCEAVREGEDVDDDDDDWSSLPWGRDLRAPRAFLVDLKRPFMDMAPKSEGCGHLCVDGRNATRDGTWHLWHELKPDMLELPAMVAFTDSDDLMAFVQLRADQVTVLECPVVFSSRSDHHLLLDTMDGDFDLAEHRDGLIKEGLFSVDEIDEMVMELRENLPRAIENTKAIAEANEHARQVAQELAQIEEKERKGKAKKAGQKAARTRKRRAAGQKAWATRRQNAKAKTRVGR